MENKKNYILAYKTSLPIEWKKADKNCFKILFFKKKENRQD